MGNLLSLFFPSVCVGCGYLGDYICPSCSTALKQRKNNKCFYCGRNVMAGLTHVQCKRKKGVDGLFSIYLYEGLFKKALIQSKYQKAHLVLRSMLGVGKKETYATLWKWKSLFSPTITYVPLHPQRENERGFNQSKIIAEHLSTLLSIPCKNLLRRVIDTPHLANIKEKSERERRVRGNFQPEGTQPPLVVILVDDVTTSGSTIRECAKTLKENGVKNVLAFSLAK